MTNDSHMNEDGFENEKDVFESLLQEKFDRDRLDQWKAQMPKPMTAQSPRSKRMLFYTAAAAFLLLAGFFGLNVLNSTDANNQILASNLIASTNIQGINDSNIRGGVNEEVSQERIDFQKGVQLLKEDPNGVKEAIGLLLPLANNEKSCCQLEALWFSALGNLVLENNAIAKQHLIELKSKSNYKAEERDKLLSNLNK